MTFGKQKVSGLLVILFLCCWKFTNCESDDDDSTTTTDKNIEAENTTPPYFLDALKNRKKACNVLIGIDEPLWRHHDQNMTELVQLAKNHIIGLNKIYSQQVFIDDYDQIYFNLKRVEVVFGSCQGPIFEENKNCTEQREKFLSAYDKITKTYDFCLGMSLGEILEFVHYNLHSPKIEITLVFIHSTGKYVRKNKIN